jgi:hypothetical protein
MKSAPVQIGPFTYTIEVRLFTQQGPVVKETLFLAPSSGTDVSRTRRRYGDWVDYEGLTGSGTTERS